MATSWSWATAAALAAVVVGLAVYLARPGIAIALVLLPFMVLDENTPDVVPQLQGVANLVYGTNVGGFLAVRDVLLGLATFAAIAWFPAAPGRDRRLLGRVSWVFLVVAACLAAAMLTSFRIATDPGSAMVGLRPFIDCVLAAFIVWRVLRSMSLEQAQRLILGASLVVGGLLVLIAIGRVTGVLGTAVEIDGVPITFFDSAGPYVMLCCTGLWAVTLMERRMSGRRPVGMSLLVFAGLLVAIASQRRSILLGYAAAAMALLVFNAVRSRGGLVRSAKIFAVVAGALVVTLVLVSIAVPGARDLLAERATTALSAVQESNSSDSSLQYRVDESDAVYALAGRHLWTGIGPTAGFVPVNSIFLPTDGTYTHNTYYAMPLRYGLWGIMALVVLVLGLLLRVARGLYRDKPRQAWILGAALIAILPAIATAAFLTQTARWGVVVGVIAGAFDVLTDADRDGDTVDQAA
ncbi:MAG: O-antigen ligase family protein [Dehalococcoidia bacterium]